jgi:arginine decarboxylase
MTAHHAVLITNVIDHEVVNGQASVEEPAEDAPVILQDMWNVLQAMDRRSVLEAHHDTVHWLNQVREMCTHGVLSLEHPAIAERFYYAACQKARTLLQPSVRAHRELLDELNDTLADKYFCNFSLFQSIPDVWAIKQIFPIVPLHRMEEEPSRRAVIQDLTCDSDGRIDLYVDREGIESTLPVHQINPGEPYLLGMFMVGAYQEILGDMHNLFGDTDSINVSLDEQGGHVLNQADQGDTVEEVLQYVHFDAEDLLQKYREKVAHADVEKEIRESYLEELEAGLRGYTYLED